MITLTAIKVKKDNSVEVLPTYIGWDTREVYKYAEQCLGHYGKIMDVDGGKISDYSWIQVSKDGDDIIIEFGTPGV